MLRLQLTLITGLLLISFGASSTFAASSTFVEITPGSIGKTDKSFFPNPIEIQVGDSITWINRDSAMHTITSGTGTPDGNFDSSGSGHPFMTPSQTFSHEFGKRGNYPYYCVLHPNMVGTVIVLDATEALPTPEPVNDTSDSLPLHIDNVSLKDVNGIVVTGMTVNQERLITISTNNRSTQQVPYTAIIQMTNADGHLQYLNWTTGVADNDQLTHTRFSWMEEEPGEYSIKAFLWTSLNDPEALSRPAEMQVTVR
jgi:plastocyanin